MLRYSVSTDSTPTPKKFRKSPAQRLIGALPKILLVLFLFVGMPYAVVQAACEPLPSQTLEKAMRNEAPVPSSESPSQPSNERTPAGHTEPSSAK